MKTKQMHNYCKINTFLIQLRIQNSLESKNMEVCRGSGKKSMWVIGANYVCRKRKYDIKKKVIHIFKLEATEIRIHEEAIHLLI